MSQIVTMRPKPGDVVNRVYHIECELGSDARSVLFGAVVHATGKRYALRCWLDENGAAEAAAAQQFVRVANQIGLFAQTGIVEVFGVGKTDNLYFQVTEWLEGTTLQRHLERRGALPADEAIALLSPILEGLAAAHAAQITHGDLRPANVFVCHSTRFEPQRARLLKLERGTWPDNPRPPPSQTHGAGEWEYLAPERLRGAPPDTRGDVYAFGVLLYVAVTGRSPFSGLQPSELTAAVNAGSWRPPSQLASGVSRALEQLITRAMNPDPRQRFQDAADLLGQLGRADGQKHEPQRPAGLVRQADAEARYTWIKPAEECETPSLFDLPAYADESHDHSVTASASAPRALQLLAALCVGVMCAVLAFRLLDESVPGSRAAGKKRASAASRASEPSDLTATTPLLPAVLPERKQTAQSDAMRPSPAPTAGQPPAAPLLLPGAKGVANAADPDSGAASGRNARAHALEAPPSATRAPRQSTPAPSPMAAAPKPAAPSLNERSSTESLDQMRLE